MLAVTATVASLLLTTGPAAPRAEGRIDTDQGRLELLGKPVRVGETIELPEGFIRVEEQGTEDRNVGSFSVVPASSLAPTAAARAAQPAPRMSAAPVASGPDAYAAVDARFVRVRADGPCRAERNAYLKDLWKLSGIEVTDPDALILGLDGGEGAATGYYWFALATDPFRPLAWSSDLRARAEALARCVRNQVR